MGDNHNHSHVSDNKKGLMIALLITSGITVLEFFGGLFTNSLALLSDAGHMLSDIGSLALSLFAMWFAARFRIGACHRPKYVEKLCGEKSLRGFSFVLPFFD